MTELSFRFGSIDLKVSLEDTLRAGFTRAYSVCYDQNRSSLLSALCDRHGSDKGELRPGGHPYPWPSHSYADVVEVLFDHCREHVRSVFECGLGTADPHYACNMGANGRPGASLRVWRDYFPNAQIYGGDIDRAVLFQEDRITTAHLDQTSPKSIAAFWADIATQHFDLMVDDGLHTFEAGVCLLENALHRLRTGGIYIIEDVSPVLLLNYRTYFAARTHRVAFINLYRAGQELDDNSMIVVRA